nr:dnaJ homolog subfamily C member 21-like [Onthophagus taurus]
MKCYYEILQVDSEADDGEIKTAYRKLALKWHPDKNLENTELAKEQFQLVQQAYDVLSDRQERAWYDKHRDSILYGANSDYQDDSLDVFPYFTTSCFNGYGDDKDGFYGVYGNVFSQINEEDMKFMDNKDEFINLPQFGNSMSDYDDVVGPFYDYWMSYSTKKTFTWLDPFDIRGIGTRRAAKLAEKENEKVRQKARRERNEEIRNLVAFVRKRDKRVQAYRKILEAKKVEKREKQQRLTKEKKLERIKQLNDSGNQAEWMNFDNVKSELEELEKNLGKEFGDVSTDTDDEINEEELNNLYCAACNKMFKNPNAFRNHETSKKHKENVIKLKEIMLEDEEEFEDVESDLEIIEEIPQKSKKKNKSKKNKNVFVPKTEYEVENDMENETLNANDSIDIEKDQNEDAPVKIKKEKRKKNKVNKESSGSNGAIKKEINTDLCCAKCKNEFPTKNKLFDHLKKTRDQTT